MLVSFQGETMKGIKCVCGKTAEYDPHLKFNNYDIDGWVCKSCSEIYYNPEKAERILQLNKLKKANYELTLTQVKSNLIVRIPKDVSDALDLHKGEQVTLRLGSENEIIMQPVKD